MRIIADSGSTKCDWLVLNDNWDIINHVKTMGYNPYFHDEYIIAGDLKLNEFFSSYHNEVREIFFYGAGCSSKSHSNIVHNALAAVFSEAEITVDHDLMASALVSFRGEPHISCILGTGSNSCHFDGETLRAGNPTLGYIVGDEASGSYFGKLLLNAYFYNSLPADLHKDFTETYKFSHEEFTANVYSSTRANVYLASFMKFYSTRKEHPYIQNVVKQGFRDFIEKQICCFEDHTKVKIDFVGSVAFFFQEEIESLGKEYNLDIGDFIQKPVFSLVEFHKSLGTSSLK